MRKRIQLQLLLFLPIIFFLLQANDTILHPGKTGNIIQCFSRAFISSSGTTEHYYYHKLVMLRSSSTVCWKDVLFSYFVYICLQCWDAASMQSSYK